MSTLQKTEARGHDREWLVDYFILDDERSHLKRDNIKIKEQDLAKTKG